MNRLYIILGQEVELRDNYNKSKKKSDAAHKKWRDFSGKIEINPTRPNVNQAIIDWFADGGEIIAYSPESSSYSNKSYGIPFNITLKKNDIRVSIRMSSKETFLNSGRYIDTKEKTLKYYKERRVSYNKLMGKYGRGFKPTRTAINKETRYTIYQIISKFDVDKIEMEKCYSYDYGNDITKNRRKSLLISLEKIRKEFEPIAQ